MENFKVKTEVFEGPLDLLLELIEKRKLLINEFSLAKIADDYIEHIKSAENFPTSQIADFILVASTLVLIKSRSLLPTLELTEEEKGNIEDLEARLKILARMKELSAHIKNMFGKNIIFPPEERKFAPVFSPDKNMTLPNILSAIKEVLKSLPKVEKFAKATVQKVVSLEEMIENLTERIKSNIRMSFKEFAKTGNVSKVNIIVSFLALLELVKQGIVRVNQENDFGDIQMETGEIGVPRY